MDMKSKTLWHDNREWKYASDGNALKKKQACFMLFK